MAAKSLHDYLMGQNRFGKLTVVTEAERVGSQRRALCKCDCGTMIAIYCQHLKRGNSRSCGCEIVIGKRTHGKFYEAGYSVWNAMIQRCQNPKNTAWADYGGRGITVCARWHAVENFLADMGSPPVGMSIDRIDPNGNYEPGNCRWATRETQARNKRNSRFVECQGRLMNVVEASEITGFPARLIYKRLQLGWSDFDAVSTPVMTCQEAAIRAASASREVRHRTPSKRR